MGYIEDNLSKDEKIMGKIKHSWAGLVHVIAYFIFCMTFAILCFSIKSIMSSFGFNIGSDDFLILVMIYFAGAVFTFLALVVLLVNIAEIRSAQLVVTNKRIFGRRGFISKRTTDILISKVDTININSGFFGAIFQYGTMEIVSGASGAMTRVERATLRYAFVANTMEFRKAVFEVIEKNKEEERKAQATLLSEAMKKD